MQEIQRAEDELKELEKKIWSKLNNIICFSGLKAWGGAYEHLKDVRAQLDEAVSLTDRAIALEAVISEMRKEIV